MIQAMVASMIGTDQQILGVTARSGKSNKSGSKSGRSLVKKSVEAINRQEREEKASSAAVAGSDAPIKTANDSYRPVSGVDAKTSHVKMKMK